MRRLARSVDGRPLLGDESGFVPLEAADPGLSEMRAGLGAAAAGTLPDPSEAPVEPVPAEHIQFGPPIGRPGKLWGIGLNYAEHAADLDEERPDEPASFMKPATAVTGPGGPIELPPPEITDGVTAEAELAVVFGRTCSNVSEQAVGDVIAGYLPVIDMTAEDILRRNPRFLTRSKSFDTFLVLGRSIVVDSPSRPLEDIEVRTVLNDEVVASNRIENMLFPPAELVAFHSRSMTFEPGDLISTGTPGAGHIGPGDHVRAAVDEIGTVEAPVVRR